MPGAPYANWFVLGFLVLIALFLGIDPSTRVALYVAPIWFAVARGRLRAGSIQQGGMSRRRRP